LILNPLFGKIHQMNYELQPRLTRRAVLKAVPALAVLAVAGCGESGPKDNQTDPGLTDAQIFNNEIVRMGHESNPKEIELWNSAYQRRQTPIPVTEQTLQNEAVGILKDTTQRMSESQNKYFSHAMEVIDSKVQRGILVRQILPSLQGPNNPIAHVDAFANDGKVIHALVFNGGIVINNSNGFSLALKIVHEAHHLEENEAFINALPAGLSAEEKVKRLKDFRLAEPTNMEANAYAAETEALLEASRQGIDAEIPQRSFDAAVAYIKAGKDRNSKAWKDYVNNVLAK
jgi:hypothetical protein